MESASTPAKFQIEIDSRVHKDIRKLKLPKNLLERVKAHIQELADDPKRGAKRMRGIKPALYRIEVAGDLRIIYGIASKKRQIQILAVRWRRSDTYDDLSSLASKLGSEFDEDAVQVENPVEDED